MSENNEEHKQEEHWLKTYWRPAMGWQYFVICMFDFLVAPILNAIFFAGFNIAKYVPWDPLTLKGAGLYHLAMGAIIGVSAWSRGQEKMSFSSTTSQTPFGTSTSTSSSFSASSSPTPTNSYQSSPQSNYTPSYSRSQPQSYDNESDPPPKGGPFR